MEWISVKDRLPNDVLDVLVHEYCCDMCCVIEVAFYEDDIWYNRDGEPYVADITHWMPLPNPPTE